MTALVHVVNGAYPADRVREALGSRRAAQTLTHHDDLSLGSLDGLEEDPFTRLPFWRSIPRPETHPMFDEAWFLNGIRHDVEMLDAIRRARSVVVWTSNAPSDRLAMLRLVAALDGIDNRVFEIDATPFIEFYHGHLRPIGLAARHELVAALGALRLLDAHERGARTLEFARWLKSTSLVRGMRDGAPVELDAVDARILAAAQPGRQRFALAARTRIPARTAHETRGLGEFV